MIRKFKKFKCNIVQFRSNINQKKKERNSKLEKVRFENECKKIKEREKKSISMNLNAMNLEQN